MCNYNKFSDEFLEENFHFFNQEKKAEAFIKNIYNHMKEKSHLYVEKAKLETEPKEGYVLKNKNNNESLIYSNGTDIVAFKDDIFLLDNCKELMGNLSRNKNTSLNLRLKLFNYGLEKRTEDY